MTLYEFDIADLAKPVETKKRKSKKNAVEVAKVEETVETVEPPAKKPRTEKQIAALEKAKETRRLKKEQIENDKKAIQDEIANKEAELLAKQEALALKKEAQKEKRRLAREAKNSASETSLDKEVNVEVDKVVPKQKNKSIAPPWFTEHITAKEAKKQARNSQLYDIAIGGKDRNSIAIGYKPKPRHSDEYLSGKAMNDLYNSMFPNR